MLLLTDPILSKRSSLILIVLRASICFPLRPCVPCSSYFHLTFPNIHQSVSLSAFLVSVCLSLYIYCISVYLSFKPSSRQFSSNFSPLQINSNSLELPFLPFFNLDLFSFQSSLSPCPPFFILLSPLFPHFFLGTIPYYILLSFNRCDSRKLNIPILCYCFPFCGVSSHFILFRAKDVS